MPSWNWNFPLDKGAGLVSCRNELTPKPSVIPFFPPLVGSINMVQRLEAISVPSQGANTNTLNGVCFALNSIMLAHPHFSLSLRLSYAHNNGQITWYASFKWGQEIIWQMGLKRKWIWSLFSNASTDPPRQIFVARIKKRVCSNEIT